MAQTGPVGHEELARMPYLEACLKVGASCTLMRWPHDMLQCWHAKAHLLLSPLLLTVVMDALSL